MSLFSGANLKDWHIDAAVQREVRLVIKRLHNGEIDPPDAIQQLHGLILKTAKAMTRLEVAKE